MKRIVTIHNREIGRPPAGEHVRAALADLGYEVEHFQPIRSEGGHIVFSGYDGLPRDADLYLRVDDDYAYPGPGSVDLPAPCLYWCIDTHRMDLMVGPLTRWDCIPTHDFTVVAQRDMAIRLGVPWVPLAYDPIHAVPPATPEEKEYDWCFVGNLSVGGRAEALAWLQEELPRGFVGTVPHEEMFRVYAASHIVLNLTLANDVNMRFFEGSGSGSPLLTNRANNGENELFEHLLYYETFESLPQVISELLRDPHALARVGREQQAAVIRDHSWRRRVEQLLTVAALHL